MAHIVCVRHCDQPCQLVGRADDSHTEILETAEPRHSLSRGFGCRHPRRRRLASFATSREWLFFYQFAIYQFWERIGQLDLDLELEFLIRLKLEL